MDHFLTFGLTFGQVRDAELSVTQAPRWWVEGLRVALDEAGRPGKSLAEAFAARVPTGYVERTEPVVAAADLLELEALGPGAAVGMAVQPDPDPGPGMFRFRLYGRAAVELSSFVPILESFGLTVVEAVPHHIVDPGGGKALHLDDFGLRARGRWPFEPLADGPRLVAAVQAAWQGEAEVDSLNRLVVSAGVDWQDVVVLRAYRRYRRQVGTPWSDRQLDDPLVEFPAVAVALLRYFATRFDPSSAAARDAIGGGGGGGGAPGAVAGAGPDVVELGASVAAAREAVLLSLGSVERLEQDQVLRAYLGLIDATVRTSHYVRTPGGERLPTLTLKLESARVPELPPPRPYVEAFVYSPQMEGMHLRGGPIARGGIRWSDRRDDLRSEVLGLVRAQVLKNAGIVPTGAKGGFVRKRRTADGAAAGADHVDGFDRIDGGDVSGGAGGQPADGVTDVLTEVRDAYRLFVSGLLDITDNVEAGNVVAPPGVVAADAEDTYLVVAADKGTATFSDLANDVSAAHHFWLGDAFASGGRHGYDHKAMGITARGAWVAARQHFRQLGIDPEREEIRVTGVGDMSGDVFGNGMLQSRTIKLIAAFDHRHIFVDPDPDPARSFAERTRLFYLPSSSWEDYDRWALSPGGGVWSRTTKQITLSREAQEVLGVPATPLSPLELVSAILTASTDLLWLGGIGTFVKAPGESHADVHDRANDTVRVDADQIRARVVAEGGNLGFTQRARIAYSRRGGKINADFIDNAAGVATSDYEVNLKILLAPAVECGQITSEERDRVLAGVQEEVAQSVLHDVGLTALAVTRAVPASAADLDAFEALMADLELAGRLDRKVEALPAGEEMAVRLAAGAGLTRPEAAVVLALAKSDLADALEVSTLVADPAIHDAVTAYFPKSIASRFADLVSSHRLYRPLAATRLAHEIVDRMGVTWSRETADELGVGPAEVGRAFWSARCVAGADRLWRGVEDLAPSIPADAQEVLDLAVADAVHTLARRYLLVGVEHVDDDWAVARRLESGALRGDGSERASSLADLGVDRSDAEPFAQLPTVALAADVGAVIRARSLPLDAAGAVAAAFDSFDRTLGLPAFRAGLGSLALTGRWGRWQIRRLGDDLANLRRDAVLAVFASGPAGDDPAAAMEAFLADRAPRLARFRRLAAHLGDPDADRQCVAALAVRSLTDLVRSAPDVSRRAP
jgi:glutamate dehydrogenase